MNKPPRGPRQLRDLVGRAMSEVFARQGFASTELVTRWADIVGSEVAAHCEPLKIQWPRQTAPNALEAGTLILRVEGPQALEIQHTSDVIIARVNRFFGWRAIGRLALRQAPLARRPKATTGVSEMNAATKDEVAAALPAYSEPALREALIKLGAAVKATKNS